jgi:hypothetical protein
VLTRHQHREIAQTFCRKSSQLDSLSASAATRDCFFRIVSGVVAEQSNLRCPKADYVYNIGQTTGALSDWIAGITAESRHNTVTESVVLPPFIGGERYAPIHAVPNTESVPGTDDRRHCRSPRCLVVFSMEYLASLRWSLISGAEQKSELYCSLSTVYGRRRARESLMHHCGRGD